MTDEPPDRDELAAHILVVDDDRRLRDLLRRYLSEHGYRVTTAVDAAAARNLVAGMLFDLVVLDVMMPGGDGVSLTRALRTTSNVPILLLTARAEPEDRIEGLEAGADDYLPKPFQPRELLLRMEAVLRRTQTGSEAAPSVRLGGHEFDAHRGELSRDGATVRLTTAETAVLRLLAKRAGTVVSRAALAAATGGGVSDRTVDVHVTRLRRKIEPEPRNPRYLKTVWGTGYTLWPD